MHTVNCQICGSKNTEIKYKGAIRNGKFPDVIEDAEIFTCLGCGVEYLSKYDIDYTKKDYRNLVDSESTEESYYKIHDNDQYSKLSLFELKELRGKKVVDIGCGAGSFLDLVKGFSSETYAIEPAKYYHKSLKSKQHKVFDSLDEILKESEGTFDIVTSFSVIEHVDDPLDFIVKSSKLLKSGGKMVFSTPNSNDILLKLIPNEYSSFFYRVVHKWYFNSKSLSYLANYANLEFKIVYKHRFDLANLISWCNEQKPNCAKPIEFSTNLDVLYKMELESKGISDYIYITATK
jgi:2-polyprenyl-3-methyl-5-hydroxy-6-metoxy-1,4-benzoquinol methylase